MEQRISAKHEGSHGQREGTCDGYLLPTHAMRVGQSRGSYPSTVLVWLVGGWWLVVLVLVLVLCWCCYAMLRWSANGT